MPLVTVITLRVLSVEIPCPFCGWFRATRTLASRPNRAPFRVSGESIGQHLHRHIAVPGRVLGEIDLAHAARANLGGDLADAERVAWSERPGGAQKRVLEAFREPW